MEVSPGIKRTAVLILLRNEDRFLLIKRLREPNRDTYTPVGGKLDPFEDPLAAAIRETWEETGIEVSRLKYCGTLVETSPTLYNWTSFVYVTDIDYVTPPECQEGTLEWIPVTGLLSVPTPKTDWYIYQSVLENKPFLFRAMYDQDLHLLILAEEIEGKVVKLDTGTTFH